MTRAGVPPIAPRDATRDAFAGGTTGALAGLATAPVLLVAAGSATFLVAPLLAPIVVLGAVGGAYRGAAESRELASFIERSTAATRRIEWALRVDDLPALTADAARAQILALTAIRAEVLGEPGVPVDDSEVVAMARERDYPAAVTLGDAGLWLAHNYTGGPQTGPLAVEPTFVMALGATCRLLDTGTGRETASRGFLVESAAHTLDEWARDDAALARREREALVRALAERAVETFVLQAGMEFRSSGTCGALPQEPRYAWPYSPPPVPRVASLTPNLAWEARPSAPASLAPPAGATEFRYDLRVWTVENDRLAGLVVERYGLPQPSYRIEESLAPGTQYAWSVRVRYLVDGRPRASRWSAIGGIAPVRSLPSGLPWYGGGQSGTSPPQRCQGTQLDICACGDFLPLEKMWRFSTP